MNSIRFGRKKVLSITSEAIKNAILSKIKVRYLIDIDKRNYKFLDKTTVFEIKNSEHLFCLNTFGPKHLLFATKHNKKNYCVFISKKDKSIVLARYRFSEELYKDTLFEGELIKDENGQWFFYLSDIFVSKGEDIRSKPIRERIDEMNYIMENEYVKDEYFETCNLLPKKYFETKHIEDVHNNYVDKLLFRTNGFLFKNNVEPKNIDILYIFPECRNNSQQQQAKKEPTVIEDEETTEDRDTAIFKVKTTSMPDVYELYCFNGEKYGHASIPNIEVSKFMNETFGINDSDSDSEGEEIKECVLECKYDEQFKKWTPFKKTKKPADKIGVVKKIESKFI